MSAFVLSDLQFNIIVSAAAHYKAGFSINEQRYEYVAGQEQWVADQLYAQNVASVNHRYKEKSPTDGFVFDRVTNPLYLQNPVALLKLLSSYDYQACETDGYRNTVAAQIIDGIRSTLIRNLPGYNDPATDID